jgi:hypothetical protein
MDGAHGGADGARRIVLAVKSRRRKVHSAPLARKVNLTPLLPLLACRYDVEMETVRGLLDGGQAGVLDRVDAALS